MKTTVTFAILLIALSASAQTRFVRTAETVADMLNQNPSSIHTNVLLSGYYAPNDGGGGEFYVCPDDGTATNNGTVFQSLANPNFLLKRAYQKQEVSVLWFGTKFSSAAFGKSRIQEAANFASNNFATLRIPNGTYYIDGLNALHFYCSVKAESDSTFRYVSGDSVGNIVRLGGGTVGDAYNKYYTLPRFVRWDYAASPPLTTNVVAIRMGKTRGCTVNINYVIGFGYGFLVGGTGMDSYYDNISIGSISDCKKGFVTLVNANQETIFGGSVMTSDSIYGYITNTSVHTVYATNDAVHIEMYGNNNTFIGTSVEGNSMRYMLKLMSGAIDNVFLNCRYESWADYWNGPDPSVYHDDTFNNGRVFVETGSGANRIVGGYGTKYLQVDREPTAYGALSIESTEGGYSLASASPNGATLGLVNQWGNGTPLIQIFDNDMTNSVYGNYYDSKTNWLAKITGQDWIFKTAGTNPYPWMEIRNYDPPKIVLSAGYLGTNVYGTGGMGGLTNGLFYSRDEDLKKIIWYGDGNFATNAGSYTGNNSFRFSWSPATISPGYFTKWDVLSVETNVMGVPISTNSSEQWYQGPTPGTLTFLSDYNTWLNNAGFWGRSQPEAFLRVGGIGIGDYPSLANPISLYAPQPGDYNIRIQNTVTTSNAYAGLALAAGDLGGEGGIRFYNSYAPIDDWKNRTFVFSGGGGSGMTLFTYGVGSELDLEIGGFASTMNIARSEVSLPSQLRGVGSAGAFVSLDSDRTLITSQLEANGPIRISLAPEVLYVYVDPGVSTNYQYQAFYTNAYTSELTSNIFNYGSVTFDYNSKHFLITTPTTNIVEYTNVYASESLGPIQWTNVLYYTNVTSPLQLATNGTNQILFFNDTGNLDLVTVDTNFLTFTNGILSVLTNAITDWVALQTNSFNANQFTNQGGEITLLTAYATNIYYNTNHFTNLTGMLSLRTVWKDSLVPAAIFKNGTTAPTDVPHRGSTTIILQGWEDSGDTIGSGVIQLNHDCMTNVITLKPHLHYELTNAPVAPNTNIVWQLDYSFANVDQVFGTNRTVLVTNSVDGVSAWQHKIVGFGDITVTNTGVSPIFNFAVIRVGSSGSDTHAGTVAVLGFDVHYPVDSLGSIEELVK